MLDSENKISSVSTGAAVFGDGDSGRFGGEKK